MKLLNFILTISLTLPAFAAEQQIDKTDYDLNIAYQKALKNTDSPEHLRKAQRTWLKFVQQDCNAQIYLPTASRGFGLEIELNDCVIEYKKNRTKQLNDKYNYS